MSNNNTELKSIEQQNNNTSPNNKRLFSKLSATSDNESHDFIDNSVEKRTKSNEQRVLSSIEKTRLNELVIEKLDFIPLHFIDDVINSVNNLLYQALDSFKEFLKKRLNEDLVINQGMHELETLLESSIDKNFDIFELYCLNNIFNLDLSQQFDSTIYQYLEQPSAMSQIESVESELELVVQELNKEKAKAIEIDQALSNQLAIFNPRVKCYEELKKFTKLLKQNQVGHLKDHCSLIKENIEKIISNQSDTRNQLDELTRRTPSELITERECYLEERILSRLNFLPRNSNIFRVSQEGLPDFTQKSDLHSNQLPNGNGNHESDEDLADDEGDANAPPKALKEDLNRAAQVDWKSLEDL